MDNAKTHQPVMLEEVLEFLDLKAHLKTRRIIDATFGLGGHAKKIAAKNAEVLGIETDPEFVDIAKNNLGDSKNIRIVRGNFVDIDKIAKNENFEEVDGILFDLGTNFLQMTSEERGFSFVEKNADLDMRLDKENQKVKASDLLNLLREDQLFEVFSSILGYKDSKDLSKKIVKKRVSKKFVKVKDFLSIIPNLRSKTGFDPATLPFMALRIAVNSELENIKETLPKAFCLLRKGGRLVVLSFHSGEDKVVKNFFRKMEKTGKAKVLTKKPRTPSMDEIEKNKSARSAKLRVLIKT